MIQHIFTVRDAKAEAYMQPFFEHNHGTATRAFQQACRTPDHAFSRNPEDFSLYALGTFDDQTGEMSLHAEPMFMVKAVHLGLLGDSHSGDSTDNFGLHPTDDYTHPNYVPNPNGKEAL